jgi:hypothetical protein
MDLDSQACVLLPAADDHIHAALGAKHPAGHGVCRSWWLTDMVGVTAAVGM